MNLGDVGAAGEIARGTGRMSAGLERASRMGMPEELGWVGPAATAAAQALQVQPEGFRRAAEASRSVAAAMERHAPVLAEAHAVLDRARAAAAGDPAGAKALEQRAAAMVRESARCASGVVREAAAGAPQRPHPLVGAFRKLLETDAELRLGAAEGLEGLASFVIRFDPSRPLRSPRGLFADASATAQGTQRAMRDPGQAVRELVDWETWRTNPARATGRVLPDVASGLAGSGASRAARATRMAGARRGAVDAAVQDAARRTAAERVAAESRSRLIRTALTRPTVPAPRAEWRGQGGRTLRPEHSAAAEEFHRLSAARAAVMTARMRRVARHVGGELVGIETNVKGIDSIKIKLSQAGTDDAAFARRMERTDDAVRYTLVFDDASYVTRTLAAGEHLVQSGYHPRTLNNAWDSERYRGVNSTWVDPESGVSFEVQFHTPSTWWATQETHPAYDERKLLRKDDPRYVELSEQIAAVYAPAPRPDGVELVTGSTFPAPPAPRPVVPPPDLSLLVGAAAGGGSLGAGNAPDAAGVQHGGHSSR